jgi:hypothetical protein
MKEDIWIPENAKSGVAFFARQPVLFGGAVAKLLPMAAENGILVG